MNSLFLGHPVECGYSLLS